MKRFFFFFCLMVSALFAVSQTRVSFTGVTLDGSYFPVDSVLVTNVTRGWAETLVYPDTTLILSHFWVDEINGGHAGITKVYPNPSDEYANVEFGIIEAGLVGIKVIGIDGSQKASWESFLQSGIHRVRIMLDKPQMALIVITAGKDRYFGKMLQIGAGNGNAIEFDDISAAMSNRSVSSDRLDAYGGFQLGDLFSFTGIGTSNEGMVVSETVVQAIFLDDTITLVFPIAPLPMETVYTIGEILQMESGTVFEEGATVYGVVTADEASGNLYKTAFIQDRATGDAIELYMLSPSAIRIGDSIRIDLKGITFEMHHGLPQLFNLYPDLHITILANGCPIEPVETTIADIVSGNHLAGLVKLSNVMFIEQNTFADPTTYGDRILVDPMDLSNTVVVRTSNYASFANELLPQGLGSLIAIATVYDSSWQLILRSTSELEFNGVFPVVMPLPYNQNFATSFGTYSTFNVLGTQSWEIDYNTAKMTGFANSVNYANEDWLISAKFSLEDVLEARLTLTYIARYFNNLNEDITLQVSTDYESGNPNDATWIQVPASWTMGSDWNTFAQTTVDLSAFAGEKVRVAVRYLSTEQKAGTIEVQSIVIEEGSGPPSPPEPDPDVEVQSLPYSQSFSDVFGTYITKDVIGAESWEIAYRTAKMSGYFAGTHNANEDWLISSPVDLTGVEDAKMTMVYIGRYFENINEDVTIWVSTDYVWDSDPTTATWSQLPASLILGSNWSDFLTIELSLSQFVGQTIYVAVKYTSTDTEAGTIEIQSITIDEGNGDTPPTPPAPGEGEGSGTADDPYNVAAGIGLQSEEPIAWVHGYIVGAVKSGSSTVGGNSDVNWSAPFDLNTNVVIADDVNCHEITQCIIVNLPAGKPMRTQVNLVDNPGNWGKMLSVNGKLRMYFGQAGLRDSGGTEADFVLGDGDTPPTPPTPGETIFSETFASSQGSFIIQDVVLPQELSYVWAHSSFQCMKASAFVSGQNHAAESWLVSPSIDLSGVSSATLQFEQAVNYASPQDALKVMISTNYNGDVTTAAWNELIIDQWPAGNNWTFINSTADLSSYVGQTVTIAFKYTSTNSASATWEVKNFVLE